MNIRKIIILSTLALIALSNARTVNAENTNHVGIVVQTDVIEIVNSLRIVLDAVSLTGFVEVPICNAGCVDTKLMITPDTLASENGKKVPLKEAKNRLGREASIVYEVKTKKVVLIGW